MRWGLRDASLQIGSSLLERLRAIAEDLDISVRRVGSAETLMTEGQRADSVFVLIDGALEVTKTIGERQALLAELTTPGSVIGEMVSMGGGTRTATVTALPLSELYSLAAERFHSLMSSDPGLAADVAAMAVRRAEEAELAELIVDRFELSDTSKESRWSTSPSRQRSQRVATRSPCQPWKGG